MKNVIQTKITTADQAAFDELLEQLETLMNGKLTALNEAQRSQYGSINEQNKLLVNKVRDYRQSNQALSAPEVDWTEFEADYEARRFLESRAERLKSLVYQMQSTKILHDYDNYQDSLTDYAYSQYKKGAGENGFSEKVADLKRFFPKSSRATPPNTENNS